MAEKGTGEAMYVAEACGRIVGFSEVVPGTNELRVVYVESYIRDGSGETVRYLQDPHIRPLVFNFQKGSLLPGFPAF